MSLLRLLLIIGSTGFQDTCPGATEFGARRDTISPYMAGATRFGQIQLKYGESVSAYD